MLSSLLALESGTSCKSLAYRHERLLSFSQGKGIDILKCLHFVLKLPFKADCDELEISFQTLTYTYISIILYFKVIAFLFFRLGC